MSTYQKYQLEIYFAKTKNQNECLKNKINNLNVCNKESNIIKIQITEPAPRSPLNSRFEDYLKNDKLIEWARKLNVFLDSQTEIISNALYAFTGKTNKNAHILVYV